MYVASMQMETTVRQVGNLVSWNSDKFFPYLIRINFQILINVLYLLNPVTRSLQPIVNPLYTIYVQITLCSCTEFTCCTTLYTLAQNIYPRFLKDANLSLTNFLSNYRWTQLFKTERMLVNTQQQIGFNLLFYPISNKLLLSLIIVDLLPQNSQSPTSSLFSNSLLYSKTVFKVLNIY